MWQKIKGVFAVIGAVLSVVFFTVVLVLLRRRNTDRQGSSGIDDRDSRITEGFDEASGRLDECRGTAERCEERLRRAEEILRNAIKRSEQTEQES